MKSVLIPALCAAGTLLAPSIRAADAVLAVGSAMAAPGVSITIPLTLTADARNVAGLEIHIHHAQTTPAGRPALTFSEVQVSDLPASLTDVQFDSYDADGTFHAAFVRAEPFDGPMTLNPKAKVPASLPGATTYALTLTAKLSDPDGKPIPVTLVGGTLVVDGLDPAIKGDLSGDGLVAIADAVLALQAAIGTIQPNSAQLFAGDLDNDGTIRIGEAIQILSAAVGLVTL